MKQIGLGALVLLALIAIIGMLQGPRPASAQDVNAKAAIEGRVHFANGKPAFPSKQDPCPIKFFLDGRIVESDGPDGAMDGLFGVRNLKPGIYEIHVHGINGHRPLRIMGVMVKPGTNTLNINLTEGTDLEEQGAPVVARKPVLVIAEELERLHKQISEKLSCKCANAGPSEGESARRHRNEGD
jgi:hypothetical protein